MSLETNSANEIRANWLELNFKLIIIDLTLLVNRAQAFKNIDEKVYWSKCFGMLENISLAKGFVLKGNSVKIASLFLHFLFLWGDDSLKFSAEQRMKNIKVLLDKS